MTKTNFCSIHDQSDFAQSLPLSLKPLPGNWLIPFSNTDRWIIQKSAQSLGDTQEFCRTRNLVGNPAQMDAAALVDTDHQPYEVAKLSNPGIGSLFTNLVYQCMIELVDRHWVTPFLKWFRKTYFIGESMSINYSFAKVSGS